MKGSCARALFLISKRSAKETFLLWCCPKQKSQKAGIQRISGILESYWNRWHARIAQTEHWRHQKIERRENREETCFARRDPPPLDFSNKYNYISHGWLGDCSATRAGEGNFILNSFMILQWIPSLGVGGCWGNNCSPTSGILYES